MSRRARDGTRSAAPTVGALLAMAAPLCRDAQRLLERRRDSGPGRGRPAVYQDWQIAALIMVAVLKKKKAKSAQYRYLANQVEAESAAGGGGGCGLLAALGMDRLPSRGTYFERYRRVWPVEEAAIELQGRLGLREHAAHATVVAADKSLIAARGPPWHQKHRKKGVIPEGTRGVDTDAAWGYSEHDDWVYGYSYEVVVCATRGSAVFPLLASADVASASEHKTFAGKIPRLPASARFVDCDSGYDSDPAGEAVEFRPGTGRRTGRRFLCPPQPRAHGPEPGKAAQKGGRARSLRLRWRRYRFYKSRRGRQVYRRRSRTVEPFNQWFKHLFELEERAWHRGLGNNRTMILCAVFCYQLLVRYNRRLGRRDACVQWILDAL